MKRTMTKVETQNAVNSVMEDVRLIKVRKLAESEAEMYREDDDPIDEVEILLRMIGIENRR